MAAKLYDLDASMARVERLRQTIIHQSDYIASLSEEDKRNAENSLVVMEAMLEIAKKTHILITEVVISRSDTPAAE